MTKEKQSFPSDVADKFMVRFPDGMRDRIAEAAKNNGRSMNAEIVHRLEMSFITQKQVNLFGERVADTPFDPSVLGLVVTVDARGVPLSWQDISAYLESIERIGKLTPGAFTVNVLTPRVASGKEPPKYHLISHHLDLFYQQQREKNAKQAPTEDFPPVRDVKTKGPSGKTVTTRVIYRPGRKPSPGQE